VEALGYRPRAPVTLAQFADPEQRRAWIEEQWMTVFSLWSPAMPATEIDLFAAEPFPFEAAYQRALRADLGTTTVTVASLRDLMVSSAAPAGRRISRTRPRSRRSEGSWREAMTPERRAASGFERHRREQRRAWLRLGYRERLDWLEQAKRFAARALAAARERARSGARGA
jgi:hypothetical protein